MKEQDVINYVQSELTRRNIFYINILGSLMTTSAGQPDIVASIDGQFVAIECKLSSSVSTVQFRRGLELISSGGRFIVANKDIDVEKLINGDLPTIAVNPNSDAEALASPKYSIEYVPDYTILPLLVSADELSYGQLVAKQSYQKAQAKARDLSAATALTERTQMQARPDFFPQLTSERVFVDWDDIFTQSASQSAYELISETKFALLTAKTGVGKTAAAVATAGKLAQSANQSINVAVIAPTKSIERQNWAKTINEWNATHLFKLNLIYHASPRGFTLAMKDKANSDIIKKELGKTGLLIIDEAHDFKNPTAKGSRALSKLKTVRKLALTATDVTNDKLRDIASYLIIAGFYNSLNDFMNKEQLKELRNKRNEFLVYDESGEIDLNKWKNWSSVSEKWRKIHVSYELPALLSLPTVNHRDIFLKENQQLESDIQSLIAAQHNRFFDTPRQVYQAISERVYTDPQRIQTVLNLARDEHVVQPLIFYSHNAVKHALQSAFAKKNIPWQEISGESKSFDESNLAPVFVQYKSGGVAIEFPQSNTSIFAENQPSFAQLEQAKGRNVRRGMTGTVTHYLLHSPTAFDRLMLEKQQQLQSVASRDFEQNFLTELNEL